LIESNQVVIDMQIDKY